MQHKTGMVKAQDGAELFTQTWSPEDNPQGVIFLIHGLAEHSGRYAHVAEALAGKGYAVCAMDLRGHGRSPGLQGYIDRYMTFITDLETYFATVKAAYTGLPVYVLGHSMGGALTLLFTSRNQAELAGAITTGALIVSGDSVSQFTIIMARVLSVVAGKLPVSKLDGTTVSRDPAVVKAYDDDPLNYRGGIRARLGAELFLLMDAAQASLPKITIPLLAMHGMGDQLVDPRSLDLIEQNIKSADTTIIRWDGLYHEIFNEPEQAEVIGKVTQWLAAH